MQPLNSVMPQANIHSIRGEEPHAVIQSLLVKAKTESNIETKRSLYNDIYQILKHEAGKGPLSRDMQLQLFQLLENYAAGTCYGQESTVRDDEEEGFRKSACLLELSLILQHHSLELSSVNADWSTSKTLEELCASLNFEKGQKSKYFEAFTQANFAPQALCNAAIKHGLREVLAQTLIRLSFSYQNIDSLTEPASPKSYEFHKKLHDLTEFLIGTDTPEQLETLEDYRYNRCCFLVRQNTPDDRDAMVKSYEPVLEITHRVYKDKPLKLNSRIAQIENMRGILLSRSGAQDALQNAEPHFRRAFELRKPLIGQFSTEKENFDQYFLLSNIRIALIKCCLLNGNLQEAKEHADALKGFLKLLEQTNNAHSYSSGYKAAIQLVDQALAVTKK